MAQQGLVVDADGHVLEPEDTWKKYLEPKFRDRAIRIEKDTNGLEMFLIDGKLHKMVHGTMANIGGIGMQDDIVAMVTPGMRTYQDGMVPGGYDPAARVKVLDDEKIDKVLLYPTLGIMWEGHVNEPALADAYCRAYNRYIVDFCAYDKTRLYPVAHISLSDPELGIAELKRARKDGCVGVYLSPEPQSRGGRRLDDPSLTRFYETMVDLDIPLAFHVTAREFEDNLLWPYFKGGGNEANGLLFFAFLSLDVMVAFTQMISTGVLERHPKLKLAVLETGCNWLAAWLDRMDRKYESGMKGYSTLLKRMPSEYFDRQCLISADPDERMTDQIVNRFGDDKVMWASDYPHIDATVNALAILKEQIKNLPADSQRKVLGDNVAGFYGIA